MTQPELTTPRSGYGGRGYNIPGRVDEYDLDAKGNPKQISYPGVTTVLKAVAKEGLHQWIADQTAAFAVTNLSRLQELSEEVGWGMLRFYWSRKPELIGSDLRLHHEGVRDDSAELGTNIHEWIDARISGLPLPELDTWEAEQMADVFEEWLLEHSVVILHSEFTVVNDEMGYAGTADADWEIRCEHDGPPCLGQEEGEWVRCLIDLKSSRHTWPEHGMQVSALRRAKIRMVKVAEGTEGALLHQRTVDGKRVKTWWIEEPHDSYDRVALLHIRPNDLDTKGEQIPGFCVLIDRTEDEDLYWMGFQGAMLITQSNHKIAAREKLRKKKMEAHNG